MFQNLIHFIKYNNAAVIILAIVLILGGGALAAGPEAIGEKQTSVVGLDNTALLAADLAAFNMDFKIENVQQDEKYYYVTYGFLDLAEADNAWQYQLSQKTQKVSKKIKEDVGEYMAKFMAKHYEARVRELKLEKSLAEAQGEQKRVEVTEYSGLIGRTLDLASAVFPGYEPVVKRELPAPENFNLPETADSGAITASGGTDNLTQIYNDYVAAHPEIFTDSAGSPQAAPTASAGNAADAAGSSPDSVPAADTVVSETPVVPETPADSAGSPQVIPEPTSVEVIELPVAETPAETAPTEPAPAPEPTPAETAPTEPAPAENAPPAPEPAPAETNP